MFKLIECQTLESSVRASKNTAAEAMFKEEIEHLDNVFSQDRQRKAGLYDVIRQFEVEQQELLREVQVRATQEKTAWLALLSFCPEISTEADKTCVKSAAKSSETCVMVENEAQEYICERNEKAEVDEKIRQACMAQDDKIYRERLSKLLEMGAAMGFKLGLTVG